MKSVLYVGATLMIGASIYGFVDYKQTQSKKEFKEMYAEEKKTVPTVTVNEITKPVVKEEIAINKINEKKKVIKKQVVSKNDAILPAVVADDEDIITVSPPETEEITAVKNLTEITKVSVDMKPSKESTPVKKIKKKKKLDSRLFSRAPLRDEEEMPEPPVKVETKKIENKEQ